MKITGERYYPRIGNPVFAPYEPFVSYEHWHRYCFALSFVHGKSVLDIASGEGYGSAYLAAHAKLVYGVDISDEAVEHARRTYALENLHYIQGRAEEIPIPGEHCFDVIVSFETIEHLDSQGQERFAAEVKRLLKPDGILLVSTPNRETYSKDGVQGNPYHFHEFTRAEFLEFLHHSFAHVRLLSQHVYPVSYIWNLEPTSDSSVVHQVRVEDGGFHPTAGDEREIAYLIAVCAQSEDRVAGPDSLMLDLSEVAFRGIPQREHWQTASLSSWNESLNEYEALAREHVEYSPGFQLDFHIDPPREVSHLRWDPLEGRLCRVRLRQVLWHDGEGLVSLVDLARASSNGRQCPDGTWQFTTLDPMIDLPITGRVTRLTIEGECLVGDVRTTMAGLDQAVAGLEQAVAGLEQAVRLRDLELDQQGREIQALRESLEAHQKATRTERAQWEREVEQRDRQIEQGRRLIEQRDRQIELKDRDLQEAHAARYNAEAELAGALSSMSFRLTAPVRAAARLARGAGRAARKRLARTRADAVGMTTPPRPLATRGLIDRSAERRPVSTAMRDGSDPVDVPRR